MSSEINQDSEIGWHVIRTRPKAEHIAAAHLLKYANLEQVFCPRIKYEKPTQRGKVWFIEALFPGYIFARFDIKAELRNINATPAVSGVLRFADKYPTINDTIIQVLQEEFSKEEKEVRIVEPEIKEGDEVVIIEGTMAGMKTIVSRLIPSQERIHILLECLGETREAEVSLKSVVLPGNVRKEVRMGEAR